MTRPFWAYEKQVVLSLSQVRVRFAPSPTGYLHIGGARTALFNFLFARHHGGKFILRVEDTDAERTVADSAEKMMDAFRWLGLEWDEGPIVGGPKGPYFQSQRREFYAKFAQVLLESGHAYKCYCTPEELEAERKRALAEKRPPRYSGRCRHLTSEEIARFEREGRKPAIRFRTPDHGITVVHDLIHGEVPFKNEEISDFIIMKSDGLPTYNFACVVDDWQMELTHVIRADEHLSNTPKQIMIYNALGAPIPKFAHVPMILAPDRSKLSKRHGAQTVEEFREKGYLPEAILNYIVLLGWTPADPNKEIMSLEEMIAEFDLSRVSSTPAIYDVQKLTWMNAQYMRRMSPDQLAERYIPRAASASLASEEELRSRRDWVCRVVSVLQERSRTLDELVENSAYFFRPPASYDEEGVEKHFTKPGVAELLRKGADALDQLQVWDLESVERAYRALIEKEGIKGGDLIHPTRLALTGKTVGPGLFDIVVILGKSETVRRLRRAAEFIEAMSVGTDPR